MNRYGSERAVRAVVIATLKKEGHNPSDYNNAGIMRDAFYDRGPGNGYGAESEERLRKAVTEHRRKFGVGDMVRVVLEVDGHSTSSREFTARIASKWLAEGDRLRVHLIGLAALGRITAGEHHEALGHLDVAGLTTDTVGGNQ
ncbi:hypothetical protein OG705_28920 [Streptomyces sp. NBC_00838]|uniref:hypothetical protein n=1 Tax=Streptomyces sp. NBC_00838 TaxID=2903680 RepID=UPI003865A5EB|nr:hypothetical protein OG705_28920 [Streptomyces sp. NBC_00838]